jgi:YfiH family protein
MEWLEPDWPVPRNIKSISTLRRGGVSTGRYASLNLGGHVGDRPASVATNRCILRQTMELPSEPVWLRQVHGCRVVRAESAGPNEAADGSYTRQCNVVCAVMTADCLPVLLFERRSDTIACLHAGWRGLAAGVLERALDAAAGTEWLAWLGPAIGPAAFAVGDEVREALLMRAGHCAAAFAPNGPHCWHADLYGIARTILCAHGVQRIYGGGLCTHTEAGRFFSYRRDGQTGRMATLIWRAPSVPHVRRS